jgi:hypothetical protein
LKIVSLLKIFFIFAILFYITEMSGEGDLTPAEVEQLLDDESMETGGGGGSGDGGGTQVTKQSTGCNTEPVTNTISTGTCTDPSVPNRLRLLSMSSSISNSSNCTGTLPRAYANVRAARSDSNTVRPLGGSKVFIKNDLGTFVNEGDDLISASLPCSLRRGRVSA